MNRQQWYYAHLRWAVMVEGKEGLRHWEEAVHIFLSEPVRYLHHRCGLFGYRGGIKQFLQTVGGGDYKRLFSRG
jgi:hypothetical protein